MPSRYWSKETHGGRRLQEDESEETGAPLRSVPEDIPKPAGIENKQTPPFSQLVAMFTRFEEHMLQRQKKQNYRGQLLEAYFERWRQYVGPDLYPVIRLMLPERDNRRRTYQLKEQKLGKAYIEALNLPKTSQAALKLEHWKVPSEKDPKGAGEFSSVAYGVIKSRSTVLPGTGTMSIEQVNVMLDRLSVASTKVTSDGTKRPIGQEHAALLAECNDRMSAEEQKWFIRIILKDLKIGMGEKVVFNAMHQDAMELFNTCSDILRVCWRLYDKTIHLPREDTVVKPGSVFRPMLCQRNTRDIQDIVKKMSVGRKRAEVGGPATESNEFTYAGNEFMIEEKLDGERIQLHKMGDRYQYNSRKSHEYTYLYGGSPTEGSLTPFIHELFNEIISECILDGEMLVWDPSLGKYVAFGALKTFAAHTSFGPNDPRPCFKVFDVLYIKNKDGLVVSMLGDAPYPLKERKRILPQIFRQKQGVLEIADLVKASTARHISDYLKRIVETRGEGIVVKHPESIYVLGGRENTWIKVKPDYMDELGETIDALVIGGYWGQGTRGGKLASFMVGVRDEDKEVDGQPCFLSFAKVGSGFNMEAYEKIRENTAGKWIDFDRRKNVPGWFKTVSEYPDQLINPTDSFVVSIKASEIVNGTEYGARMTLRFPRAIKIRDDLDEGTCMSLAAVRKLMTGGTKRGGVENDLRGKNKKIRTAADSKAHSLSAPLNNVKVTKNIFQGLVFYVNILKSSEISKPGLEEKIAEHGGRVIQTIPNASSDEGRIVIASEFKPRQGIAIRKGVDSVDVISEKWVLESISVGKKIPLYQRFYVRALETTKQGDEYSQIEDDQKSDDPENESKAQEEDLKPAFLSQSQPREVEPELEDDEGDTTDEGQSLSSDGEEEEGDDVFHNANRMDKHYESPFEDLSDVTLHDPMALTDAKPGMGAGLGEAHFDPDRPFAPLVGYFDTSENARLNQLELKSDSMQTAADKRLRAAETDFVGGGGTATEDLRDSSLTHLIVDNAIQGRYKSLINMTAEPRYRRIVTHDWISDSLELGEGVADENDYQP